MWVIEKHATIDFETKSSAGFRWGESERKWLAPRGSKNKGLKAIGTFAYAEHPSTEVLTLSYRIPGDQEVSRWRPGLPLPVRLFEWIANGGLVEAHNSMFEKAIWDRVCRHRYGFPVLPLNQVRCSMARANVNNYPAALDPLSKLLPTTVKKNPDGRRLLNKFSIPRNPTKNDPRLWITPENDPEDGEKLYSYCDDDVRAEEEVSELMMPLSIEELRFWLLDQEMNWRGIGVDVLSVTNMIAVMEEALERYGDEFRVVTGGLNPTQIQKIGQWLADNDVFLPQLDEETIDAALGRGGLPDKARRALEIRGLIGSASVKKLYAIERCVSSGDRVRNVIIHHGARTGRPTGDLLQPLNLPKAGPDLVYCANCKKPSKFPPVVCPWCATRLHPLTTKHKWPEVPKGMHSEGYNPVDDIQQIMETRSLEVVEHFFGDALLAISGCIRGMITAGPGKELIASDYSAIEAVVTAVLAGCQWRIDAFRRKEDIYLVSAAKITGKTYEFYTEYKSTTGSHHSDRQKIGKVAELALGFGGWLTAWQQFDTANTPEDEIKRAILAWRAASPEIVEMWGGQYRGRPWRADEFRLERFGFEGAFVNAIQYPDQMFTSHGIKFYMRGDALIIRLLSGRELTYHSPELWESDVEGVFEIMYMTWNTNAKYGPPGWGPMKTYSGRIAENVVQATAHDIQRYGILALEAAGYPIILHVYDENVGEVPIGWGSLEEFEKIMSTMPPWASDWPVRASGGWRGKRYRKA
jgi:DNA polymerase